MLPIHSRHVGLLYCHVLPKFLYRRFRSTVRTETRVLADEIRNYFLVLSILFIFIPLTMIITSYSIIIFKLKSQKLPGEQSGNAKEQRAKRQRKMTKMATAIVFGFAVCWIPLDIYLTMLFSGVWLTCQVYRYGLIAPY